MAAQNEIFKISASIAVLEGAPQEIYEEEASRFVVELAAALVKEILERPRKPKIHVVSLVYLLESGE